MAGFISIAYFLSTFIFGSLIFILWIRFALKFFCVSALHPAAAPIFNVTNPIVLPINRLLSTFHIKIQRYDLATLLTIFVFELLKYSTFALLSFGFSFPWIAVLLFAMADLVREPCDLLFYAVLIRVVISWVKPNWQHPLHYLSVQFTEPLMAPIRRIIPSIAGLDLSPLILIVLLKTITLFISAYLPTH